MKKNHEAFLFSYSFSIAQINPANSLATATVALHDNLPRLVRYL